MGKERSDSTTIEIPDDFAERDRKGQVSYVAEKILEAKGAFSQEKGESGKSIFDELTKIYPDHGIPLNSFNVCLSTIVQQQSSRITKEKSKKGYFLTQVIQLAATTETETVDPDLEKKRKEKEKILYQIFVDWLLVQGIDQVKDTSSARNQDLGTWGNPDITGIRKHEILGRTADIEITTIEVKATPDNWKYWIFESVAHKRFSNRCYFAFAYPEELMSKLDADMKQYAELYGVGILVLPLTSVPCKSCCLTGVISCSHGT